MVPLVDRVVADGLPGEVVGDRADLELVLRQRVQLSGRRRCPRRPARVEVVAPAGDLQPVVPPPGGEPADLLEGRSAHWPVKSVTGRVMFLSRPAMPWVPRRRRGRPWAARCRPPRSLDRVEHALHASPSANEGTGSVALGDRGHQVDDLVGEAVLVAEPVAGGHQARVGVPGLGDQDPAEARRSRRARRRRRTAACSCPRSRRPGRRAPLTSIRIAFLRPVANRVASNDAERAAAEAAPRKSAASSTVTSPRPVAPPSAADRPLPSRAAAAPSRTSRSARDPGRPVAGDELGHVDDVRADVAQRPRAGLLLLQPPGQRASRGRRASPAGTARARAGSRRPALRRPAAGPARPPAPGGR